VTLAANGGVGAVGTAGNDASLSVSGGTFTADTLAVNGGTFALTGGTLNLGAGGLTRTGVNPIQVNLGAGTVGATAAWTSSVAAALTDSATGTSFDTTGGNIGLSGSLSGSGKLVKTGSGTLNLTGANNYAGSTDVTGGTLTAGGAGSIASSSGINVTSGGTLLLGGSGIDRIGGSVPLTLSGGKFSTAGLSNQTEALGTFNLSGNSVLDFGSGLGDQLFFSAVGAHTASTTLSILNWSGIANQLGDASSDRLIFDGFASSFSSIYNQSDVSFDGVSGYAAIQFGGQFEIVAVPEPSSTALVGASTLLALVGLRELRRRSGRNLPLSKPQS
jgi:autotransporter-associated beta strand protein